MVVCYTGQQFSRKKKRTEQNFILTNGIWRKCGKIHRYKMVHPALGWNLNSVFWFVFFFFCKSMKNFNEIYFINYLTQVLKQATVIIWQSYQFKGHLHCPNRTLTNLTSEGFASLYTNLEETLNTRLTRKSCLTWEVKRKQQILISVWRNFQEELHFKPVPHGHTINAKQYCQQLD